MQKKNKKTKKKPFNYKKLLIFIFCFIIVIFSAKPIFNWSLTSLIKISSKKLTNHNISFKTYKIRNKTIILKDVFFFDKNRTLAHTDEIDLLINYKIIKPKITADILVKNPNISLFKKDDLKLKIHPANKSKIFSYTLKIENGQINLLNKENEKKIVYFDFLKKDAFLSKFQISFDKEKIIPIDINRINKKISFRTTLDEIEVFHLNDLLSFFNKKIFEEIDGQANGLMVVDIENDKLTNFYANLDLVKLKAKNLNTDLTCEMDKLHFELEYPDCNNEIFDSIYLDFLKNDILKSTRLRAEVDNLSVISPNKTVLTDISGFLSFNPGFGFKMNFLGKGENFKKFNFEIFSKAFFSSSDSNWLDLNFSFDDLSNKISLKTKQIEKDDYLLSVQFDNLMPHIASAFQDVLSKVFPEVKKAKFLNGEINLIADAKFSKVGFEQVNLSDLKLNNFEFEIFKNFKGFISKLEDKSSFNLKHENFWDKFFSDLKIYSAYFDINGNKITDFNTQMLIADGNFQSSYASLFINNMKSEITFDGNIENFNMLSKTKGKLKHFKDDFSVIMTCLRRNQKYQCSGNVQIEDNQDAVFEFALNKAFVFNFQDFKNSISSFWIRAEKVKLHKWPKIFDYNLDIDGLANLFVFYKNEKLTCQIKGENLKYKNDYIDVSIKNIGNINNHIFEDKKCIEAIYQNNKLFTYFPKFEGSCKLSKYDLLFDLKDSKIDVMDNVLYAKLPNCSALDVNLDGNVCFDFRKKCPLLKITVNEFNSSIKSFQNFSKKFDFSSDLPLEGSIFGKSEISLAFSDKLQTSWNIELNIKDAFYQVNKFSKLENIFAKARYSSFDDKFEIIDKFTADLNLNNKILKLNCPIFIKKNQNYSFDMRLEKNIFDIFRIKGKLLKIDNKYQLKLSKKSHFFSEDLTNLDLVLNENFSIDQLNFKQNESFYSFFSKLQFLIDLNFLDFKNLNLDFLKNSYTNGDIKYQIFLDDTKKLTFEFLSKKLKILNSNFERFYLKAYKDNSQILVEKIHLDDFDGNIALDIKDDFCKFQNIEIKKKEALFLKMKGNYLFSDAKFNMVIDD
ncbi:MAG: hypothetical protein JXA94_01230, partial [Parachlamydiales bacterium]|nr:hypothetical protein [Parachlamydiales bacterium]